MHSGFGRGGRPSLGAWTTYGLGSENENLPAYVVLLSGPAGGAGSQLWSSGFCRAFTRVFVFVPVATQCSISVIQQVDLVMMGGDYLMPSMA